MLAPVITAVLALTSTAAADAPPLRRESLAGFAVDEPFQRSGGVQLFYGLTRDVDPAGSQDGTFAAFRPFDFNDRFDELTSTVHVVMSRLVHTVNKDVSFFTEARARDLEYLRAIAPTMKLSQLDDGRFRVGVLPQNDFAILYFGARDVQDLAAKNAIPALLLRGQTLPATIVVQENTGFSRVMGWRTAEMGVTWTAHYAVSPGVTRVEVATMSYLHTLPPFFLGGVERVYKESLSGALGMIQRLRAYEAR